MTAKILGTILTVLCLTNCSKGTKTDQERLSDNADGQITAADIYSTLEYTIAKQKLNKDYGLKIVPIDRCDLVEEDADFLESLILTKEEKDSLADSGHFNVTGPLVYDLGLQKCLTKEDVDFMISQKATNRDFQWDNSKLGFNPDNHDNWYEFSVPLFTKDKSKAIFLVAKLCKGLCGTEQTFLVDTNGDSTTFETGYLYNH